MLKTELNYPDGNIVITAEYETKLLAGYIDRKYFNPIKVIFIPNKRMREENFQSFLQTKNLYNDIKDIIEGIKTKHSEFYSHFEIPIISFPSRSNVLLHNETLEKIVGPTDIIIQCIPKD